MVVNNPRVGLKEKEVVRCPHCRKPNTFTEWTLALDEKGVPIPLVVDHNGAKCLSTLQICGGCKKKVLFIDEQLAFPWRKLPDVDLIYVPENLRSLALDGYQLLDSMPALSAAALRCILEQVCIAGGWRPGAFATYVDFLADALDKSKDAETHGLLASLNHCCRYGGKNDGKNDGAPIPTDRVRWEDDTACVYLLMNLIDNAAWLLRAALAPKPPRVFLSHATAPTSGPA
jgi:hypothetical protein